MFLISSINEFSNTRLHLKMKPKQKHFPLFLHHISFLFASGRCSSHTVLMHLAAIDHVIRMQTADNYQITLLIDLSKFLSIPYYAHNACISLRRVLVSASVSNQPYVFFFLFQIKVRIISNIVCCAAR